MKFTNILFVTDGIRENTVALRDLLVACKVDTKTLTLLAVMPKLPESLLGYSDKIKNDILSSLKNEFIAATNATEQSHLKVEYEFIAADNVMGTILDKLASSHYDCLVKVAEDKLGRHKGFEALDMNLIRKSPCPIWIVKGKHQADESPMKLAVAIDASLNTEESYKLAVRLLRCADSIAKRFSVPIEIVSCWSSVVELAQNEPFVNISAQEIENDRRTTQETQLKALTELIAKSDIQSEHVICQRNGDPDKEIPAYTLEAQVSLLVMGTLSRRGIAGMLVGNTAENVIATLDNSILVWPAKHFA